MHKIVRLTLAVSAGALFAGGSAVAASGATTAKTFTVHMAGSQEVPKGSPTGTGVFKYQIVSKTSVLCYSLNWNGIDTPFAAHIHKGAKGTSGPIVIILSTMAPVKQSGCVKVKKSLLTAITKNPGAYYVNVHTKKYPAGAIRGQLP
jgi:CHRD domain